MKVLVTGGAGFIGTHLIELLLLKGHDVISVDNYQSGSTDNHIEGARYIRADICNIMQTAMNIPDIIFHLAADSRIQPTFEAPSHAFHNNVHGTEQVCEYARKNRCKMVYAGSSSRWHDPHQSPYATYKYLGEEICKMYQRAFGMDIHIVRFYNVYGSREIISGDWTAVIGLWRGLIRDGKPITVVGDGEQRRDFTHVSDIVDGLYRIAEYTATDTDGWELGCGKNYSVNEVAQVFQERFGCEVSYIPEAPGNYRYTLRECDKALRLLGWKPVDSLKEYISFLGK